MDARVRKFVNENIDASNSCSQQIEDVLSLDSISELIILPDIHSKPDSFSPKGIVAVSPEKIYPFIVSKELGCGIRVVKTDLFADEFAEGRAESFFKNIQRNYFDKTLIGNLVTRDDYINIFTQDWQWIKKKFSVGSRNQTNEEKYDSSPQERVSQKDIFKFIPRQAFAKSYRRLGILGGGNHFLEMQVVSDLLDEPAAGALGLKKGQIIFMLHTGGELPAQLYKFYETYRNATHGIKRLKLNFRKFLFHFNDLYFLSFFARMNLFFKNSLRGIPGESPEAEKFLKGVAASYRYCFFNRCVILKFVELALKETLRKNVQLELLSDIIHESITPEILDGEKSWVHRNGATKIYEGDLIPLPGFIGGPSFLCAAGAEIKESRNSINHGVGRTLDKEESKTKFTVDEIQTFLEKNKVLFYKMGTWDLREQAPFAFKNIGAVIATLKKHRLSTPILMAQPLAILKG